MPGSRGEPLQLRRDFGVPQNQASAAPLPATGWPAIGQSSDEASDMDAISLTACGIAGRSPVPFVVAPRRLLAATAAVLTLATGTFLRARRLLATIKVRQRQLTGGSGDPEQPSSAQLVSANIWDDAALWMLMMH
jgi:hypothetical protein